MPTLAITNFNIVVSVLGGWVSLFGLVSYLCKERFYLSEARTSCTSPLYRLGYPFLGSLGLLGPSIQCLSTKTWPKTKRFYTNYPPVISLLAGVAFSPPAANFVRPLDYAGS